MECDACGLVCHGDVALLMHECEAAREEGGTGQASQEGGQCVK